MSGDQRALLLLAVVAVVVLAAIFLVSLLARLVARSRQAGIDTRKREVGRKAEQFVAAELHALQRGYGRYYVFNGIKDNSSGGRGDIDHLVIGPPGIFVVETKGVKAEISADYSQDPPLLLRDGRPFIEDGDQRPKSFLRQLDFEMREIQRNVLHPYKQRRGRRRGPWVPIEGRVCFPRADLVPDRHGSYPPRTLNLDGLVDDITSHREALGAEDVDLLVEVTRQKYGKAPAVGP